MRRKKAVTAGLAMIAVGLVAAVLVISYHHTSVMLKGLVDLHPAPGEEEVHLVEWSSTKLYVVQRAAAFRGCVAEARDVDEGLGCIGRLISSIRPRSHAGRWQWLRTCRERRATTPTPSCWR